MKPFVQWKRPLYYDETIMQNRRMSPGGSFRIGVCAIIALFTMTGVSSFAQGRDSARIERPQRPDRSAKPDVEEIKRLKQELRENMSTQPAIAIQITSIDDKKIAATALREERSRIREEIKATARTQKGMIEEAREEASRRIAEAKERARNSRQRD